MITAGTKAKVLVEVEPGTPTIGVIGTVRYWDDEDEFNDLLPWPYEVVDDDGREYGPYAEEELEVIE